MAKKPVAVTHELDDGKVVVVARFDTISEAEAHIEGLCDHDKAGVEAGLYGIDAPETMINPREA